MFPCELDQPGVRSLAMTCTDHQGHCGMKGGLVWQLAATKDSICAQILCSGPLVYYNDKRCKDNLYFIL